MARVTAALADAPVAIGSRPAGWATGLPARRLASRLFNRATHVLRDMLRAASRSLLAADDTPA